MQFCCLKDLLFHSRTDHERTLYRGSICRSGTESFTFHALWSLNPTDLSCWPVTAQKLKIVWMWPNFAGLTPTIGSLPVLATFCSCNSFGVVCPIRLRRCIESLWCFGLLGFIGVSRLLIAGQFCSDRNLWRKTAMKAEWFSTALGMNHKQHWKLKAISPVCIFQVSFSTVTEWY